MANPCESLIVWEIKSQFFPKKTVAVSLRSQVLRSFLSLKSILVKIDLKTELRAIH